jgi:hypothetical protein
MRRPRSLNWTHRSLVAAGVFLAWSCSAPRASAESQGSALVGWVEDIRGEPIAGALISLFGKGIKGGGLIAFSDDAGHFILSPVPAGSYTVRALERSHVPSPPHHVTIFPNQDTLFSLSLAPLMGQLSKAEAAERTRELEWLLRHKRRSVLEDEGSAEGESPREGPPVVAAAMVGAVELMTSPGTFGAVDNPGLSGTPVNWSVIRLRGHMRGSGEWSVSGLVSDADRSSWRMAGEFTVEPWQGHAIRVGSGYGTWVPHPVLTGDRALGVIIGAGAAFLEDKWSVSQAVTATLGARYSYIGFVNERNHIDPRASIEVQTSRGTRFQAGFSTTTLAPGGDLLAVPAQAPSSALSLAATDSALRPERVLRCSLGAEHPMGATSIGLRLFQEATRDQLLNTFDRVNAPQALWITNGSDLSTRGIALTVGHQILKSVGASVTYTYGQAQRSGTGFDPGVFMNFRDAHFQDVTGRMEAVFDGSETRLVAFYRINTLRSRGEGISPQSVMNSRFDVEIRQGLPFLGALTRADWELLVAMRNLFYPEEEAGLLDEFAVVNPPKRVLGGISVRF